MDLATRVAGLKTGFSKTFWIANTLELFERFAYYASKAVLAVYIADGIGLGPVTAGIFAVWSGRDALALILVHMALGRRARLRQFGFVAELTSAYRHVIVMGDLNCRSDSPELISLINRAGLREPAHDLHTFPSCRPMRNIDHILVSPSIEVDEVSVLNYPLSDHLPIAMQVRLPEGVNLAHRYHAHWDEHLPVDAVAGHQIQ